MGRLYYLMTLWVVGFALAETTSKETGELEQQQPEGSGDGKNSTDDNEVMDRINPGIFMQGSNGFGTFGTGWNVPSGMYPGNANGFGFPSMNGNGFGSFGQGNGYTCICPGGQTGIITGPSNIPLNPGQNGVTNTGFGIPMYPNQPYYPGGYPNIYGGQPMNGFGERSPSNQNGGNDPNDHSELIK